MSLNQRAPPSPRGKPRKQLWYSVKFDEKKKKVLSIRTVREFASKTSTHIVAKHLAFCLIRVTKPKEVLREDSRGTQDNSFFMGVEWSLRNHISDPGIVEGTQTSHLNVKCLRKSTSLLLQSYLTLQVLRKLSLQGHREF